MCEFKKNKIKNICELMRVFLLCLLGFCSGFTFPKMRTTSVKLKAQKNRRKVEILDDIRFV